MSRMHDINHFYALLNKLTNSTAKLGKLDRNTKLPAKGVYFFFEDGEVRNESSTELRVTRIGTHAVSAGSSSNLAQRLKQHRGNLSGGGKHRGSVFRQLIGLSLIERDGLTGFPYWGKKDKSSSEYTIQEVALEEQVSAYLGKMSYLVLEIDDEASKNSDRAYIEKNAIALLSGYGNSGADLPSADWLGNSCPHELVRPSGLWNADGVKATYDPDFLKRMEELVNQQCCSDMIEVPEEGCSELNELVETKNFTPTQSLFDYLTAKKNRLPATRSNLKNLPESEGLYMFFSKTNSPFVQLPGLLKSQDGHSLLYTGISANLKQRLRDHVANNAAGSSMRRRLGCFIASELNLSLRRTGKSGKRLTFGAGEKVLNQWIEENLEFSFVPMTDSRSQELNLLHQYFFPLNKEDVPQGTQNKVWETEFEHMQKAKILPVLPDNFTIKNGDEKMRKLILFPCCSVKKEGSVEDAKNIFLPVNQNVVEELQSIREDVLEKVKALSQARIEQGESKWGKNLSVSMDGNRPLMPAIERYQGKLYTSVPNFAGRVVQKIKNSDDIDMIILSALYGPLHPQELIEDYNIEMKDTQKLWQDFMNKFLPAYVAERNIDEVHLYFGHSTAYFKVADEAAKYLPSSVRVYHYKIVNGSTPETPKNHGVLIASQFDESLKSLLSKKFICNELTSRKTDKAMKVGKRSSHKPKIIIKKNFKLKDSVTFEDQNSVSKNPAISSKPSLELVPIEFAKRSSFTSEIMQELDLQKDKLESGQELSFSLSSKGGYGGIVKFEIRKESETHFFSHWKGDISRLSSRLKAVATALKSLNLHGEFVVSHKDGLVTVEKLHDALLLT